MELKISTLMQVPEIDEIIVNTNSEDAIRIVNECYAVGGVKTYRREEYYASSECSGSEFFRNLGEVTDTDVFMYCPCTSPFVKPETISQCIRAYAERGENDCVSTVSQIKEFLWLDGKPLNYDPSNAPNSQDLPDMVALNFGVTVIGRQDLINNRNIIGKNPRFVVTSDIEAIDIDTPLDFYIAEQIYRKNGDRKAGVAGIDRCLPLPRRCTVIDQDITLMTHMKTITAIIPVRAGSTRLKNKNVAPFAGTNLLVNKINQLKQVKDITKIVVSSDSDLMLEMAKQPELTPISVRRSTVMKRQRPLGKWSVILQRVSTVTPYCGQHAHRHWCSQRTTERLSKHIIRHWNRDLTH